MAPGYHRDWADPLPLAELATRDMQEAGVVFAHDGYLYKTTGEGLGRGGMGSVFQLLRRPIGEADQELVVGKVFHPDYLQQIHTDDIARRDHLCVIEHLDGIAQLCHPHILPLLVSSPIADNVLMITPRMSRTLHEAISRGSLEPRRRVELLMQAIDGLGALHGAGYLHRDFTIRNVLLSEDLQTATLFDFDLSLPISVVTGMDYRTYFQGRIFGSPGYSLAPEILNEVLMSLPVDTTLDIYAIGTSLFALFTEELPYPDAEDMWSLLLQVGEGVVRGGHSTIPYPDSVPRVLRPIIESCMERTPAKRPQSVGEVLERLTEVLPQLKSDGGKVPVFQRTISYGEQVRQLALARAQGTNASRSVEQVDVVLRRHGYEVSRALGHVKGNAIFVAVPIDSGASPGRLPVANPYPKIVTVLDLSKVSDSASLVDAWFSRYQPRLRDARQGLVTPLYLVVHDEDAQLLLLLTEYVDDARFGTDLSDQVLELEEAFGLGYLLVRQIVRLHNAGVAHNNVSAQSLLIKGDHRSRRALPAMLGIVHPSEEVTDMYEDVSALATLVLTWIDDGALLGVDSLLSSRLSSLHEHLGSIATGHKTNVHELSLLLEDALATLNYNFGVLRENSGDLESHALLLVGHSLYGRLWSAP